uniref:Uncharacterized protein n=1 Tax=Sphaerodactylus townsendi TaxID=933632 RepID=A0ACB8F5C6_9SAUR
MNPPYQMTEQIQLMPRNYLKLNILFNELFSCTDRYALDCFPAVGCSSPSGCSAWTSKLAFQHGSISQVTQKEGPFEIISGILQSLHSVTPLQCISLALKQES